MSNAITPIRFVGLGRMHKLANYVSLKLTRKYNIKDLDAGIFDFTDNMHTLTHKTDGSNDGG